VTEPEIWRAVSKAIARIRALPTWVLAVLALVIWLACAAYALHFFKHWEVDLRVYRAAGSALYHGGGPYSGLFTAYHLPFTYPPFALLVLSPLSLGPLGLVETLWWLASALALVLTLFLLLRADRAGPNQATCADGRRSGSGRSLALAAMLGGIATLACEPVRSNFDYGQINLVLMAMVVLDATRGPSRWRGTLVGLAGAVKLTPLVYLGIFVVRKDWRSLGRGVASFSAATLGSWLILPHDSALYWLHDVVNPRRTGAVGSVTNQSWYGMLHRAPFHGGRLAVVLWAVLAVATLACGLFLARRLLAPSQTSQMVLALALTELLVSPVSWTHHWSWVAIVPVVLIALGRTRPAISSLMVLLLAVAIADPYRLDHGPVSFLTGNSLLLCGAVVLIVWAASECAVRRHAHDLSEPRPVTHQIIGT
jgi:alpha-1,2-mannosyltransferase